MITVACVSAGIAFAFEDPAAIDKTKLPPAATRPMSISSKTSSDFRRLLQLVPRPRKTKSNYRLDVKASAERGDIGGSIIPGNGTDSHFHSLCVRARQEHAVMPAKGERLTGPSRSASYAPGSDQGAKWPAEADAKVDNKANHWAFKLLAKPPIPAVKTAGWVRTPIDAFILNKLEEKGFTPSAQPTSGR